MEASFFPRDGHGMNIRDLIPARPDGQDKRNVCVLAYRRVCVPHRLTSVNVVVEIVGVRYGVIWLLSLLLQRAARLRSTKTFTRPLKVHARPKAHEMSKVVELRCGPQNVSATVRTRAKAYKQGGKQEQSCLNAQEEGWIDR